VRESWQRAALIGEHNSGMPQGDINLSWGQFRRPFVNQLKAQSRPSNREDKRHGENNTTRFSPRPFDDKGRSITRPLSWNEMQNLAFLGPCTNEEKTQVPGCGKGQEEIRTKKGRVGSYISGRKKIIKGTGNAEGAGRKLSQKEIWKKLKGGAS